MNVQDLYELASAAALDSARWVDVLRAACAATGAMGGAMFSPGVDVNGPHLGAITDGYGDISGYKAHWAAQDPWLVAVAGKRFFETAGDVHLGREFLPDAQVKRTAYYNDFGRFSGGGAGHKISLKVCDANDPVAPVTHFIVGRPFSSREFDEEDKRTLARFWRPVQHAVRLHWKLARGIVPGHSPAVGLNLLPMPTFILREDAFVEFCNASALEMLRTGRLVKEANGYLRGAGNLDCAALKTLVAGAGRICCKTVALTVEGDRVRRLTLSASPIRQVPHYACAWPRASVMLVLLDGYSREGDEESWQRCLARHFALTPSEQYVLRRIAAGRTVEEISLEKDVIPATIRTHLNSLFDKTGRRRQSELVRLVAGR
ncbi:helix-turn-helix transcriptional regulator [Variovorax sp. J22R133]|uniref:helix-turn-helix transcriptional regulator n=1 Tax=Variovorax brevis TaxID=3053503 RepID=UPI00257723F8|nr:helix-turn-helix transcriptional regulator [Variovorax sp. J22R133]MDM0116387.1 helix-turn-helix transcriptional regulator [Variovorax sp. J22R133]